MSFDIVLIDTDALGLSRSESRVDDIIDAANDADRRSSTEATRSTTNLQRIVDRLEEIYGTLRSPHPECPWVMWPPGVGAGGHSVTLCVGWDRGDDVLRKVDMLCTASPVVAVNAQPVEDVVTEGRKEDRQLGTTDDGTISVYLRNGAFGPIFVYGNESEVKKPELQAIRKAMNIDVESATLDDALKVRGFQRVLGQDPEGEDVIVKFGADSPYFSYRSKYYASPDIDAFHITLQEAIAMVESGLIEPNWRSG